MHAGPLHLRTVRDRGSGDAARQDSTPGAEAGPGDTDDHDQTGDIMSNNYMPTRPYFAATNADRDALAAELADIDRELAQAEAGKRTLAMTFAERNNLEARRKELKQILGELSAKGPRPGDMAAGKGAPAKPRRLYTAAERVEVARLQREVKATKREVAVLQARARAAGLSVNTTPGQRTEQYLSPSGEVLTVQVKKPAGYAAPSCD